MEHFHPSQISWTTFPNANPTSISQLWPPSDGSWSRETTPETTTDSTVPPTTDTSFSDHRTVTDSSSIYPPSPELFVEHAKSIDSLRSFVKKEIGLNAIDNRLSLPALTRKPSSSWCTVDSDSVSLATWTREQAIRTNQSVRDFAVRGQGHVSQITPQTIAIKKPVKRGLVSMLKGTVQAPPQALTSPH